MEYILICIVAFLVAILTFFSGFGLGTILTPVFMLFFPVELAIALTGVVHFFNNVFKIFLVGRKADKGVLLRFGIPAVIFSFIGAWVLLRIPDAQPL
ncbi:MAG: sulfite exporter TauE/SafE family protein, partial [Eudoraea sp.]|nr:sulfite exporter TauE/SafE family protein [Eudoraea sp.]